MSMKWKRTFSTDNGDLKVVARLSTFDVHAGVQTPEPNNSIIVRAKPEDQWRIRRPFPQPWEWHLNDDRLHAEFDSAEDAVAAIEALVDWYDRLDQRWAREQAAVLDRLARRRVWLDVVK